MALDQISAITEQMFIPILVDNVLKSNPLMVFLARKAQKVDGGSQIIQPVVLSENSTATSYSGADVLPLAFDEEISAAQFDWSQYAVTVSITGLDDLRNAGGRGVINLIKSKIQIAEATLRENMGADLQLTGTGNNSKALLGLGAAVDDGTNVTVYGNLSRTTYTNWEANYSANGAVGRQLSLTLMNTEWEAGCKDNTRPNLGLTTHLCFQKYMSLLQPNVRYSDTTMANMGFPNLMYQGRPLVVDEQVQISPVHKMWFLNTNFIDLITHRDRNFLFVPFQQLAKQDAAVAKILWAGQLVCSSPRMQVQITDINPSL